ncbi:MAG: hypothetical protein WDO15_23005 [Bacteroidota bacterium]
MAFVGGTILILFGLYHLIIKTRKKAAATQVATETQSYRYILKGFFINAFSPMVPILWIGYISIASIDLKLVKRFGLCDILPVDARHRVADGCCEGLSRRPAGDTHYTAAYVLDECCCGGCPGHLWSSPNSHWPSLDLIL